jgi:hypothetical protein
VEQVAVVLVGTSAHQQGRLLAQQTRVVVVVAHQTLLLVQVVVQELLLSLIQLVNH